MGVSENAPRRGLNKVDVVIAAGELGDTGRARDALRHIQTGGMTNLSGGLLRGTQEAQWFAGEGGATLVLLSDGHANEGVTDHDQLADFAAGAYRAGVATSTIGIGGGYDEDLLAGISRGGQGNTNFAPEADAAGAHLADEVDGLLEKSVQAVSLTVRPSDAVSAARLFNDLPASAIEGGFMVEIGDLHSAETRRLILEIDVPAITELGPASACELELRWVEVDPMEQKVAQIPVNVNVVPGDQAAGRVRDPEVETELAFQQAQHAKRDANAALLCGDIDGALENYSAARIGLGRVRSHASGEMAGDFDEEMQTLEQLAARARDDANSARKISEADYHRKARRRGRR